MTGRSLKLAVVQEAREEEIDYARKMEYSRLTTKQPIDACWVDISKQDESNPTCGSRLVAEEIRRAPMPDVYARDPNCSVVACLFQAW